MRSSFVFFALIVKLIVVMNCANASRNSANNQTPLPAKTCEKPAICNCNLTVNQDSHVSDAIKNLGTKLDKLIAQNLETKLDKLIAQNLETKLAKLIALVNKTSTPASPAVPASSCKELYEKHKLTTSQVYTLMFGSQKIPVYCHMGNFGCGDGGWTLAMKIDGNKKTFHYDSHFWSDKNPYNIAGGQTDFDTQETKLPTYWNTSFSKICLGMRIGHEKRFVVINKNANSLYSLIADGKYRATSLGRNTWKHLIGSQASLQPNCNMEGFNAVSVSSYFSKARIGFLGNEQNECNTCDSRIGFGTGGSPYDTSTCGNEAQHSPDNGVKHIKTMGYILVQ